MTLINAVRSWVGFIACVLLIHLTPLIVLGEDGPTDLFIPTPIEGVGGTTKFTASTYSYFCDITDIAPADLDNDGDIDLVLLAGGRYGIVNTDAYTVAPIVDWPGKVNGNFDGPLVAGDYLYGKDAVDLGVVVSPNVKAGLVGDPLGRNYPGSDLAWLQNDGVGHFSLHYVLSAVFTGGVRIVLADLDNDGDSDIVIAANRSNRINWYKNRIIPNGSSGFDAVPIAQNTIWGNETTDIAPAQVDVGDFDGDGKKDVLAGEAWGGAPDDFSHPSLRYYPGEVDGSGPVSASGDFLAGGNTPAAEVGSTCRGVWSTTLLYNGFLRPPHGTLNDLVSVYFDNDGLSDFIMPADNIKLFRNTGGGVFDVREVSVKNYRRVAAADMNGDGLTDVVAADGWPFSQVGVYLTDDPTYTSWTERMLPDGNRIRGAEDPALELLGEPIEDKIPVSRPILVDINNDGMRDIVLASRRNKYSETFKALGKDSLTMIWVARHKDLNHNHKIDPDEMRWDTVPLVEPSPVSTLHAISNMEVAVADFDGDGDLDVVRSSRYAPLMFFQNVWNTKRKIRIVSEIKKAGGAQKTTSWLSVMGSSTTVVPVGVPISHTVGGQ